MMSGGMPIIRWGCSRDWSGDFYIVRIGIQEIEVREAVYDAERQL